MIKEQKFYKKLQEVFIGAKIEGEGGFINLMRIKSSYYSGIEKLLKEDVNKSIEKYPAFREELFDKLYSFFGRYFTESGSIYFNSTPFHNNIYEKVYTNEKDVILFWKTQMLYYIKTDRIFKSMPVKFDGLKFYIDASQIENKKVNEKRALIFELNKIQEDETIVFSVKYSDRGKKTKNDDILKGLKKKNIPITEELLEKAFRVFKKQGEVDFFINKNAKAFLQEQFKLWSYQYFWEGAKEWSIDRVNQLQILKNIAFKVIDFISQFEDELMKIWNKPKFVRKSNYVITLDRIKDKELAEKVLTHNGVKEQIKEWQKLGIVDEKFKVKDIFEDKKYEHLPIDTKYFKDLELEILSLFDDLDNQLDGWLIKSENYQALNTLLPKFKEKVQTIYIDPPYNAKSSEIYYLNQFKHSSWLSLMENRIGISKKFLKKDGVYIVAIDESEQVNLGQLIEYEYPDHEKTCVTVVHNPSGQQGDNFSYTHDFAYFIYPKGKRYIAQQLREVEDIRNFRDVTGDESLRTAAQNCFYPILVKDGKIVGFGDVSPDPFHPTNPNVVLQNGVIEIYPIDPQGIERKWRFARNTVESIIDELEVKYIKSRKVWDIIRKKICSIIKLFGVIANIRPITTAPSY